MEIPLPAQVYFWVDGGAWSKIGHSDLELWERMAEMLVFKGF